MSAKNKVYTLCLRHHTLIRRFFIACFFRCVLGIHLKGSLLEDSFGGLYLHFSLQGSGIHNMACKAEKTAQYGTPPSI